MADRVSLSTETPDFEGIAAFHDDAEKSLRHYYAAQSAIPTDLKFAGYTPAEIVHEREDRLATLDGMCAFALLASLEADFRTDFLIRCQKKLKDELSREFRLTQRDQGKKISFERDILDKWDFHFPQHKSKLSRFRGALHYRHWIAHGQYYQAKFGKKGDFYSFYSLAKSLHVSLPFQKNPKGQD